MNDFTKEELNTMADGIVLLKKQCKMDDIVRQKLDMLDEKLCSMINNYCDHKEVYDDYNDLPMRCRQCLEIVG